MLLAKSPLSWTIFYTCLTSGLMDTRKITAWNTELGARAGYDLFKLNSERFSR